MSSFRMGTDRNISLALFTATVLSRLPFTCGTLFNLDSVNFALGMDEFDVTLCQPHPPGYILYVLLGRLARLALPDTNAALISISVISSALTVLVVYHLGREMFSRETGVLAALAAMTSPVVWLNSEVALTYMTEALMSVLVAYLCFRMSRGKSGLYALVAVVLAASGGIRQNTMVFLMPLWLYSMRGLGARRILASFIVFGAAVAAWFVPMVFMAGGYSVYRSALGNVWQDVVWWRVGPEYVVLNAKNIVYYLFAGLLLLAPPLLAAPIRRWRGGLGTSGRRHALFFAFWLVPALLFHVLIFFQAAQPGYVLIYLMGLLILASAALMAPLATLSPAVKRRVVILAAVLVPAVNVAFFFFSTYSPSYGLIQAVDEKLPQSLTAIRENFSPEDTEIISGDQFLFSYRHAMYYLPEFRVHNTVRQPTSDRLTIYWGKGRKTYTEEHITPIETTRNFVDFYLYSEEELSELPRGTRFIKVLPYLSIPYYSNVGQLAGVERIEAVLDPELSGRP